MNDSTYLIHHGIKGQRWGVRRFQNEDGTYTNRGKNRLKDDNYQGRDFGKSNYIQRKRMSDDELLRRIGRLSNEKRLKDLERDVENDGSRMTKDALRQSGSQALTSVASKLAISAGAVVVAKTILGKDLDIGKIFEKQFLK